MAEEEDYEQDDEMRDMISQFEKAATEREKFEIIFAAKAIMERE